MNSFMKWMLAILATATMAACEVEKEEEGEMPSVDVEGGQMPEYEQTQEGELPDVDAQAGKLPDYDVDAPDVDVGTEEKQVTVPDVDVDTEEKSVSVPTVDINRDDEDNERQR